LRDGERIDAENAPTALFSVDDFRNGQKAPCHANSEDLRDTHSPCRWLIVKRSVIHFVREDDEFTNVKTPAQYIASLPADSCKDERVRNKTEVRTA
jgi:hypothetical protein